jgi:hypothetical protein
LTACNSPGAPDRLAFTLGRIDLADIHVAGDVTRPVEVDIEGRPRVNRY